MMPRYQKRVEFHQNLETLNVPHQMQDAAVAMNPKSHLQITLDPPLQIQIHLDLKNRVGRLWA